MEQTELISTLHGKKEMYTHEDMIDFGRLIARTKTNESDQSVRAAMHHWIDQNSLRVIWKGRELQVGDEFEVNEDKTVIVRFKLP